MSTFYTVNFASVLTSAGFYQRGDPDNPLSIETSFRSLARFQQQCTETFPGAPPTPQVQRVNRYGGWDMTPSNVLFTNGECASARCPSVSSPTDTRP